MTITEAYEILEDTNLVEILEDILSELKELNESMERMLESNE